MLDTIVPQATFTINEDATHTTSIAVELVQFKYFDATSGINQIRFRNDGETWQEVWQDMTEMLIKWKLRAEDGTRTVHMQVSDKAGNMATYSDSIVLDTTVPFGTITILGQNLGTAYATATNVTLNLTLADDVVEMRFSNNKIGSWSTWQAAAGTVSNWLLNQGLSENEVFTDGTRCVWMEVKDIAGKTAMYSDNIILDRTAPSGNVIVNGANEFVDIGTRTVRLSMSYADATVGVDAIRYGYEGLSGTETWVYDWGTPTVQGTVTLNDEEGIRKLIYEIRDVVGWTYKTSDTIMLDTIVPQIATTGSITVVYPTAQTRAKEGDVVTIMALVQDVGAGIETISLDASNIGGSKEQPMSPGTQAGVYLAQVTLSHTPIATETQASISVTAQDRAGNQASSTTTVFVDNKMPIFSTVDTLLSVYKNGDMLQLTAKLDSASYTVSIDLSGLDSTYRLGSESVTTTSEGTYTIVYQIGTANTTPDGSYELKVKAQDQAGNVSWRSTSVLLDNTAPVQLLKAEPSIVRNGDTIVFTYYGTDPGLPITEIPYSEMQKLDSNAVGTLILHDDGNLPDMVSNDGICTASYTISGTNTISGTTTGGLVTIGATIVDLASNTLHAKVTITLDNTKPGVELLAIGSLQTVNNIIIFGTATENITNIVRAEYRIDDIGIWFEATPKDGLFDENIEAMAIVLTNLTDGSHTVVVHAEDLAGNVSDEVQISFQVDTQGPIITNLKVSPDPTNGTVSLTGTATDGLNPIGRVEYYIDTLPQGGGIQMSDTGSIQTDITGTISIAGLKEGKHSVYVRAQDNLGNWGTAQKITFTISKSKLLVYINPVTPDPIGTTNITISGYAVDVHAPIKMIEVRVDNKAWGAAIITDGNADEFIEEYTYQLPADQLTQGTHNITVRATDMADTIGLVMDTFVVDLATSTLTMSTEPQWASSRVIIIGTATDQGIATGIIEVEYRVDGEAWQTAVAADGTYDKATETFRIEINGLSDGTHTVTARSMDMVGNVSDEVTIGFHVDTTGPIISNLRVTPDPTNGTASLTGTATDTSNIITKVEYYIDTLPQGTSIQMTGTGSRQTNISGVINITDLTEGKHTAFVRAQDSMGNWGSVQQFVFAVSRSNLFVEINPVTPDPIGTTNITITGRVIAPQVAIKQIDVQIDGGQWIPAMIVDTVADELVEEFACILPTGSMTDGVHIIVVRATDVANTVGFGTETFEVDTQVPQVNAIIVIYPTGQTRAKEGDVITIIAQVDDSESGIASVILDATRIGGGLEQVMCLGPGGSVYLAQVTLGDTPMGTEMQRNIIVTVEDKARNQRVLAEGVFMDNKLPVFGHVITASSMYKDGDVIEITARLDANYGTSAVSIDFSGIDSTYQTSAESVTVTTGGTYTISYQIGTANTIPDGSYGLVVRAIDQAGNVAVRSISVRLDNTAPSQLLKAEPSLVRNGDTIVFTYQAGEQGLRTTEIPAVQMQRFDLTAATLTLHDDSNSPDEIAGDGVYTASHTISKANAISGTVTNIAATIVDMAGNTLITGVSITLDNTLPAVQLGTIAAMQAVNSLTIFGTATENITSIVSGEFMLDGTGVWHGLTPMDGQFSSGVEPFAIILQGLADGSHTVMARVMDRVGNVASQSLTFCVDTQGPGTISLSLTPEIVIGGTSTLLAATITDAISPVVYAEYYLDAYPKPQPDGVLNIGFQGLTVVSGADIYVATLTEGNHIVYVRAQDELGNWSSPQSAIFRVGKGGIGVVIETQGSAIGTTTTDVCGYANAFTYKVIGLQYRVGTGTWTTITSTDGRLNDELKEEFIIHVAGLKEGINTIEVKAQDEVGNVGTDSVDILVDTVPSYGSITINENATYTTAREVILSMSYGDDVTMVRYSNAGDFSTWEPPATTKIWMLPPQDGTWTVSYQVMDKVGNIAEFSDSIILDTKVPAFIGTVKSDRTAYRNGDTINLTARMDSDGYTITVWLLPIDSTAITPVTMTDLGNGTYTMAHTISTTNISPDGVYPILITAVDKAGNVKQISISLALKNTSPMYGLSVDPSLPPVVKNGHILTFVYAGAETNLPTTTISLNYNSHPNLLQINGSATGDLILLDNGIAPDKVANDGVYMGTVAVNTTIEGTITVYATIINSVGNVMNPWTSIRVDNTPPMIDNIIVAYPTGQARAKEGDTVAINVGVTDAMLATVKLDARELNGESAEEMSYNATSGMYTAQVTVVDTTSGAKTIAIISTDEAGNISRATTTVMIDNQPPRFSLLDSDRSLYKNGWTMTITAVLDDSSYRLSADFSGLDSGYRIGSETVSKQGNTYTIVYIITGSNTVPSGVYSIPVKAVDEAGNIAIRSISVELNNMERIGVLSVIPDRAKLDDKVVFTYTSYQSGLTVTIPAVPNTGIGTLTLTDTDNNGTYIASVTITGTSSGTYTVRAEIRDGKGKLFSESEVQLFLRTIPPVLALPEELYMSIEPKPTSIAGKWEVYHEHIRLTGTVSETANRIWWEIKGKYGRIMGPIPNGIFFFDDIYLEQGTNTIVIFASDDIGNVASQTLTLLYVKPRATVQIGISGGTVHCPNGSSVFIPQDALQETVNVSVNAMPPEIEKEDKKPYSPNTELMGVPHEVSPGIVFHKPVTVTLAYTDMEIEQLANRLGTTTEAIRQRLVIFFWDEYSHDWIEVGGQVSRGTNTVSVTVNHATIYDIGMRVAKLTADKVLVYVTRNPFRQGERTQFVADLSTETLISIRIFDLSGDLVRTVARDKNFAAGVNVNLAGWDGLNDYNDFVGTGIYVYQVEIESGGKVERITKPIGVVK